MLIYFYFKTKLEYLWTSRRSEYCRIWFSSSPLHALLVLYKVDLSFANLVISERIYSHTGKQSHKSQVKQAVISSKKLPVCFNPQIMLSSSPDMINSLFVIVKCNHGCYCALNDFCIFIILLLLLMQIHLFLWNCSWLLCKYLSSLCLNQSH